MKIVKLFILILIYSGIFASCSATRISSTEPNYKIDREQLIQSKDLRKEKSLDRKIQYSALMRLIVESPDTANVQIEKIVRKYNGYINEIGTYRTVIRVKNTDLDAAIKDISSLGKVRWIDKIGQDVTEEYTDYQIRLENAEKARKRYLELLAKAENVEATLKVEKELERLNETIELLKGKMNRINHLSQYSTITINLKEKKKPGLLGYIGIALYHSVKWLFVRN